MNNSIQNINTTSPMQYLERAWQAKGTAIGAIWLCCFVLGIVLTFLDLGDRAFAWSLRLGVLIACVGMGVAFLMTSPTSEQIAEAELTGSMPVSGAHAVGAPDDAPGS